MSSLFYFSTETLSFISTWKYIQKVKSCTFICPKKSEMQLYHTITGFLKNIRVTGRIIKIQVEHVTKGTLCFLIHHLVRHASTYTHTPQHNLLQNMPDILYKRQSYWKRSLILIKHLVHFQYSHKSVFFTAS